MLTAGLPTPTLKCYFSVVSAPSTDNPARSSPLLSIENESYKKPSSVFVPHETSAERVVVLLIFLGAFAYLCLFRRFVSMDPDEGIILQGAERILHGQVIYRDFFSYFTPGSYYLYALLFKFFGSSILVARTLLAVYGGLFSVFTYLMARRVCPRGYALFASYLVSLTCLPWRFLSLHNWDSTLWACAAVYAGVRFLESRRTGWIFAAGSFASLTFLFEQSRGGGLVFGMGLGFALILWLDRSQVRLGKKQWALLATGLLWPFALTFCYFAWQHALPIMVSDWLWPLHHYAGVNSVPYGYQKWPGILTQDSLEPATLFGEAVAVLAMSPTLILPSLPIIALLLGAYWIVRAKSQKLEKSKMAYYVFACSCIVGLLLSVLIARADVLHFVYLIPLLYIVLAWVTSGADIRSAGRSSFWACVSVAIFLIFTATGLAFLVSNRSSRVTVQTPRGAVRISKEDSVLKFTLANVQPGSRILVYPYLPLYYFLTATFNPTRYDYLQPGMHTSPQREDMIREIRMNHIPVVLFELGFNEKIAGSWPRTPLRFVAGNHVEDFILAAYQPCKILRSAEGWRILYMVRKGHQCPPKKETVPE